MIVLRTIDDVREALADRAHLGLVPTMGALHAGHRSLLDQARRECELVVMSLFVNPSQFAAGEDFGRYPRDEASDLAVAEEAGVDVVFAPSVEEIYPPDFATTVVVGGLREPLEGRHRGPEHFDGVATVVVKLLNIVGPQVVYFGAKDAQQVLVVRRAVRDLAIPTRVTVCPTVREGDGLALSSRNVYLDPAERRRAAALPRALHATERAIAAGERDAARARAAGLAELEREEVAAEYLEVVDPQTLAPIREIATPVLVALAARLGATRLIDNLIAAPNPREPR